MVLHKIMEPEELSEKLDDINAIGDSLRDCTSIPEGVQKALKEVRKRLKVQVTSIFLFSKDGVLKRIGIDGKDKNGSQIDGNVFLPDESYEPGESFSGKPIPKFDDDSSFGKPVYSNNLNKDYAPKYAKEEIGDLICGISVPLNDSHRTFGTLEVLNNQSQGFSLEDIYWLMFIGTNVSNFIVNFRQRKRLDNYREITDKLMEIGTHDKSFDLEGFYQEVANKITEEFTPYKACIIRIADEREDREIKAKSSISGNGEDSSFWENRKYEAITSREGGLIARRTYETKRPFQIVNIDSIQREKFFNKEWVKKKGLKGFLCLPLTIEKKCVGTISVYTKYPHKFDDNYRYFLENLASLTASATAKVRLIQDFRKLKKERDRINESIVNETILAGNQNMIRGILHDYKNDLIDFSVFLQRIVDNISNKEKEVVNKKIESIAKRIETIYPSLELEQSSENIPVDINEVIKETVQSFLIDENVRISLQLDNSIPVIVVNKQEIQHIVLNLISNAEKAIAKANAEKAIAKGKNKNGRIEIKTSLDVNEADQIERITITVEDNGVGIPNEIKDEVFKKEFTTGGTGIGLFVVKSIIDNLGGKIYFDSAVDKGTKFYVRIPWKRYGI